MVFFICGFWKNLVGKGKAYYFSKIIFTFLHSYFFFGLVACGVLVPQPGIRLLPPALEARSLNNWTTREALMLTFLNHW